MSRSRNPWGSEPHHFVVEELLDHHPWWSGARTAMRQWQQLVEASHPNLSDKMWRKKPRLRTMG